MKLCLPLSGRKSWCPSTREWWALSSLQWFLGVSQVLQSSVTKPWNHISPRKHTSAMPWCLVPTSCSWFMGRVYLPMQWGQSHRRHYLYWPRTGIYQSDCIRSSTDDMMLDDDIMLDPVTEMIIHLYIVEGLFLFMESIHSPAKNPLPSRHKRVYFKLARLSVLKMFKMFWMRNMRVRYKLSTGCFVFTSTTSQYSVKHQKKPEDLTENIYPVRSKTLGSIEMWSVF